MYILCRTATLLRVVVVALCSVCLIVSSVTTSPNHPSLVLQMHHPPPCGLCKPSLVVETWLLLVYQWEGFNTRPIGWNDWLQLLRRISCTGNHPTKQDILQQYSGASCVYYLSVSLVEVIGWCLDVISSCPLGEPPGIIYKVIFRWLSPILTQTLPG